MTDMPRMNVESFNLDHTAVAAPFIRLADRKELPHGDVLTKFDLRFTQPNVAHLDMPAIHSIEHAFAECVRRHSADVIDFGPMGCQTGFYLIMSGDHTPEAIKDLVLATIGEMLTLDAVPAANEIQCGWGAHHSLAAMREAITEFAAHESELLDVMR